MSSFRSRSCLVHPLTALGKRIPLRVLYYLLQLRTKTFSSPQNDALLWSKRHKEDECRVFLEKSIWLFNWLRSSCLYETRRFIIVRKEPSNWTLF
jgi:hypothetical protein